MSARFHSLFLCLRPLIWGPVLVAVLALPVRPGRAVAQATAEHDFWGARAVAPDTLTTDHEFHWGPIPARADSVTAEFREQPRPAWETAVMVPYWIVGVPFRLAFLAGDQTIKGMDKLGMFGAAAEYPGIKGPGGSFIMPTLAIHSLEGLTLGLQVTKPHFLNQDGMLFLRANRSVNRGGAYGGGTLFHLGEAWQLELGGGFESRNQARFHGLGPTSQNGDLSYYYRSTAWSGFDLDRELVPDVRLGLRAYFSQIQVRQAAFNQDQSLDVVHPDNIPPGYPGQSNGWTLRWGLDRNNTTQRGRPSQGGYQSLGLSWFGATDGSDLSYLTWHANLEKYFKLWHTDRSLAVRGFANRITKVGSQDVPFSRLVTFQRPDELRGFHSLRFYGLGSVGVSVEYRWPVWVVRGRDDMGVDAYLFSDSGQVFDHTAEINLTNFQWTAGGGLRLIDAARGMAARFELGFSDETTVVRLTFSQTFQYNPRGFLYGKNPTKVY